MGGFELKWVVMNQNGWCWVEKCGGQPKWLVLGGVMATAAAT